MTVAEHMCYISLNQSENNVNKIDNQSTKAKVSSNVSSAGMVMGGETVTNHGHTKCSRPPHCLWLGCSKRMLSFRADYDNSALDKCNSAPLQCLISCFALCRASCRYFQVDSPDLLPHLRSTTVHGLSAIVYVRASRVRQAEITCSAYAPPHYDEITACSLCQLDLDSSRPPKTHSAHTQAE
jgi:hypothetical protein